MYWAAHKEHANQMRTSYSGYVPPSDPTPTSALPSALQPAAAAAVTAELAASQRPVEVRAKVKTFTGVDLLGGWTQHPSHLPHL